MGPVGRGERASPDRTAQPRRAPGGRPTNERSEFVFKALKDKSGTLGSDRPGSEAGPRPIARAPGCRFWLRRRRRSDRPGGVAGAPVDHEDGGGASVDGGRSGGRRSRGPAGSTTGSRSGLRGHGDYERVKREMAMSEKATSRGGFNVRHLQHGRDVARGKSGTRGERSRLLHEAMRDLDEKDLARQARRNPSIVPADAELNFTVVNDGAGGFRRAVSIDEVLDYGDSRVAKVRRKINARSFETTTMVAWAPTSILREVPDFYPVLDKRGEEVGRRSRWVIDDRERCDSWMRETVAYIERDVLRGGHDAVHAVVVNLDESRPHIHIMADSFAPDPKAKEDGDLRVESSQMWGSHRDVREERVDPKTGETKSVQLTGATKMRRYQAGYRARLIEAGFVIEAEANPEGTSLDKRAFAHLESERAALASREAALEAREATVEAAQAGLAGREEAVEAAEAELPTMRRRAKEEGRAEGRAEGLTGAEEEKRAILDEARAEAQMERMEISQRAQRAAARIEEGAREKAAELLDRAEVEAEARVAARVTEAEERIDEIMDAARVDAAKVEEKIEAGLPAMYLDKTKAMAYSKDGVSVHDHVRASMEADPRLKGKTAAERKQLLTETKIERGARVRGNIDRFLHKDRAQQQSQQQDRGHDGPAM